MVLEILTVLLNIAPWHNFAYGADLCGIKRDTAKEIHELYLYDDYCENRGNNAKNNVI